MLVNRLLRRMHSGMPARFACRIERQPVFIRVNKAAANLSFLRMLARGLLASYLAMAAASPVMAQPASDNISIPSPPEGAPPPKAGMGIMAAEVSFDSALVQLRLTGVNELTDRDVPGAWGVVEFQLYKSGSSTLISKDMQRALPHRDFITRTRFRDLEPDTRYICRTRIGLSAESLAEGPQAAFRTHAGEGLASAFQFVVVTGMNYAKFHGDTAIDLVQHQRENNSAVPKPYDGPDKALGYPALATIAQMRPDFFIGTGDNVYYDTPDATRATTVESMRRKWHEQFVQPRYQELFASVPTMWMVDDHDYRIDDADNLGDFLPLPSTCYAMMLEQLPYGSHQEPAPKTYRTFRVSKDLQIWLPENRLYRSPNALPDTPSKTIWGAEQKAWLKRTLAESDATFKLLISPTPMIGPDDKRKNDNHVDIGGFQAEQKEFFDFLATSGLDESGCRRYRCHYRFGALQRNGYEITK